MNNYQWNNQKRAVLLGKCISHFRAYLIISTMSRGTTKLRNLWISSNISEVIKHRKIYLFKNNFRGKWTPVSTHSLLLIICKDWRTIPSIFLLGTTIMKANGRFSTTRTWSTCESQTVNFSWQTSKSSNNLRRSWTVCLTTEW